LREETNHGRADVIFVSVILKCKSVNIAYYGKEEHLLDIKTKFSP
jgi:hypothetical protein